MTAPVRAPYAAAGTAVHPDRFPGLDAYRALGMTMVLLAHAGFASGWTFNSPIGPILARMDLGLPIFFVVSGFLLYRPFVAAQLAGREPRPLRTYLRHRFLRIYPGYWVALAAALTVFGGALAGPWAFVTFVTLTQTFFLDAQEVVAVLPQAWSIGVELTFYVLLPLWALLGRRLGAGRSGQAQVRLLVGGAALLYLAGAAWRATIVYTDPTWLDRAIFWLPSHLDFFALGMGLAVWSAATRGPGAADLNDRRVPAPLRWLAARPWLAWAIGLALFAVATSFQPPPQPLAINGREYVTRQFLYGLIAVAVLTPAFFGDQRTGWSRRLLASRPLVALGLVSYGFYLYHLPFLQAAEGWLGYAPFQGNLVVLTAVTVACTLPAAAASYLLVERPLLRRKDRPWREWFRARPAPTSG